jgi:hypothetical protein
MRLTRLTVAIVLIGAATGASAAEKGAPLDDASVQGRLDHRFSERRGDI